MKFGKTNIVAGCAVIFIATIGGFVLGASMDPNFQDGFYKMSYPRALMKSGHTHGMLFAYYNLIVGLLLARLELSGDSKLWLSRLAIGALLVPLGVFARGLLGGTEAVMPVVAIGAVCYLGSAGLILKGALAIKTDQ